MADTFITNTISLPSFFYILPKLIGTFCCSLWWQILPGGGRLLAQCPVTRYVALFVHSTIQEKKSEVIYLHFLVILTGKVLMVHCTHGLNRTGYLVTRCVSFYLFVCVKFVTWIVDACWLLTRCLFLSSPRTIRFVRYMVERRGLEPNAAIAGLSHNCPHSPVPVLLTWSLCQLSNWNLKHSPSSGSWQRT